MKIWVHSEKIKNRNCHEDSKAPRFHKDLNIKFIALVKSFPNVGTSRDFVSSYKTKFSRKACNDRKGSYKNDVLPIGKLASSYSITKSDMLFNSMALGS